MFRIKAAGRRGIGPLEAMSAARRWRRTPQRRGGTAIYDKHPVNFASSRFPEIQLSRVQW